MSSTLTRAIRNVYRVYDVRNYGAIGDGSTADSVAIKAAADAAHAAGGGQVQLMPGVHAIPTSITNSYKKIKFKGYPGLTTLKATESFTNGIINLDAASSFVSDIVFEDIIFDCNNQTNVAGVTIKGGTFSAGAYADTIQFKNCYLKNYDPDTNGLVTIYTGRGESADRGPVTNVKFWNCDFGVSNRYHVYINGPQLESIYFIFCRFHDGATPYSFGFNAPSLRDDDLGSARSNKDALFSYCKWYDMNTDAVAGFYINDTARTGWRDMTFDHCQVEGHSIAFDVEPDPENQEVFCNVHSTHGLRFTHCLFREIKTAFSFGQSNNAPHFQADPEVDLVVDNCTFFRIYGFADNDASIFARITNNKFYEMYSGGITLGYSNHNPSIFAHNYVYNVIQIDEGVAGTATTLNSAISVDSDGWMIFSNHVKDDRLLANPTTAPTLTAVSAPGAPGGTRYFAYSWENDTGETQLSAEASIVLSAGQTAKVEHPYSSTYGPPSGAKLVNFYGGSSSGNLTKQDYMPLPIHLDYETDHYTTYAKAYWQMPTAGLISGSASPGSNTTHTRMKWGIHQISGGATLIQGKYYDNHFYGIVEGQEVELNFNTITYNNWSNPANNSTGDKLIGGYKAITTTYTVKRGEFLIDCTSGTFTVTLLPVANVVPGRTVTVKNSGAGTITVDGNSSETIDGSATDTLAAGEFATYVSTGSAWIIT